MSSIDSGIGLVQVRLFEGELATWGILDGASVPKLVRAIGTHGVESACLFAGKLHPSMARVAPYLVRLERETEFVDWVFERGWGRHWGVFLRSPASLDALRKHLRDLLMVKDPDGKVVQFRFYDPRVLRLYLPTCTSEEAELVFGPVERFAMEAEDGRELLEFRFSGEAPVADVVSL